MTKTTFYFKSEKDYTTAYELLKKYGIPVLNMCPPYLLQSALDPATRGLTLDGSVILTHPLAQGTLESMVNDNIRIMAQVFVAPKVDGTPDYEGLPWDTPGFEAPGKIKK